MASDLSSFKDVVNSFKETQLASFQNEIQNTNDKITLISEHTNNELDKISENLIKLEERLRSTETSNVRESQKLQSHIDQYKLDLTRLETRLENASTAIESLKQWRYIQLGAVGVISAIITIIMGAAVAYITKLL